MMHRTAEITLWVCVVALIAITISGIASSPDGVPTSDGERIDSADRFRYASEALEKLVQTLTARNDTVDNPIDAIVSTFQIPPKIEEPVEAVPLEALTADETLSDTEAATDTNATMTEVSEEDTGLRIDGVEMALAEPKEPMDAVEAIEPVEPSKPIESVGRVEPEAEVEPEPATAIEETYEPASWIEYAGRMTRNGVDVYYLKDSNTGRIMQLTENESENDAVIDRVEDGVLYFRISDEKIILRFEE